MASAEKKTSNQSFESDAAALFSNVSASLPGATWLQPLRSEAMKRFAREGLPHKRVEWWKYTDLRSKIVEGLGVAGIQPLNTVRLYDTLKSHRIKIDGALVESKPIQADLPDGLEILSLAETVEMPSLWLRPWLQPSSSAIENLNLAFAADGFLIRVGANVRVETPILVHSLLSQQNVMAHTRSVVLLEKGAELTLIEVDYGTTAEQSFSTANTVILLEQGSRLRHLRISAREGKNHLVRSDKIDLARDASYEGVIATAGAALVRQQQTVRLSGHGASFNVAAAYAPGLDQHADYSFEVAHAAPQTTSRILVKGVATANGRGVVQGRVVVEPDAQQSDSHQMARGLILTAGAEIDQRPELEIYADDVKCGHGATIGSLDVNQLFYLQSRGIPEAIAREILISAFITEITQRLPDILRADVDTWLTSHMEKIGGVQ